MNDQEKKRAMQQEAAKWSEGVVQPGQWENAPEAALQRTDIALIELPVSVEALSIVREMALRQGISYQTLLNQWIEERLTAEAQKALSTIPLRKVKG